MKTKTKLIIIKSIINRNSFLVYTDKTFTLNDKEFYLAMWWSLLGITYLGGKY